MDSVILSKDSLLEKKILEFYTIKENLNIFLNIILQKTRLSLRALDWFVTNYSKKYNVIINENYYPFKSYKSQLKAYSKKYCDPFCRRNRIIFDYENNTINNDSKGIITTLGQLNFFKFAISNGIIDYCVKNIDSIEADMNDTLKKRESEKKFLKIESIKRKELSKSIHKSVNISIISAVIKFV